MSVNTLSLAALLFTGLASAAVAAPLPVNADSAASIQGRDVYSRFLPGAYVISPGASDGGPIASGINTVQNASPYNPPAGTKAFVVMPPVQSKMIASGIPEIKATNTSDPEVFGSQGGNAGTVLGGTGSDSGTGTPIEGSPTHVGAVPLPPALPLFGAAVLGLALVGRSRRHHAAKP